MCFCIMETNLAQGLNYLQKVFIIILINNFFTPMIHISNKNSIWKKILYIFLRAEKLTNIKKHIKKIDTLIGSCYS